LIWTKHGKWLAGEKRLTMKNFQWNCSNGSALWYWKGSQSQLFWLAYDKLLQELKSAIANIICHKCSLTEVSVNGGIALKMYTSDTSNMFAKEI